MSNIKRYFVERKEDFRLATEQLKRELIIDVGVENLKDIRHFSRYDMAIDVIDASKIELIEQVILSEPRTDNLYEDELPIDKKYCFIVAIESLPGQYDQREDSCQQCIELLLGHKPLLRVAEVYVFYGKISVDEQIKIKNYLLNPVESRLTGLEKPSSLRTETPKVEAVKVLKGFIDADEKALGELKQNFGLAMDLEDLKYMQRYFLQEEKRDPSETEMRVIDTYWSDHCRHTTFNTRLEDVNIDDERVQKGYEEYLKLRKEVYGTKASQRPITLMDMATIATKTLKKRNLVHHLDESEEINACSVNIMVETDDGEEPWLYMFKNETHNHPTEIEPFGGAATCLGGAIRDPLSGRSYVYQGMRLTGAADPRKPLHETLPGKLPQRRICTLAAAGFSSYGNQIGLATGLVDELYHPGYEAKRMEVGAVIAAAPKDNVLRSVPEPGDLIVLIGGKTGRDGCGGATGSSKIHTEDSLETSGAEVQKGNPVEERKIQRLFRKGNVAKMIRRCNDFGAGGVSVAVCELADGVRINLDTIPKKYEGLNGTELAISESQERMACVISENDWRVFSEEAAAENLEATIVAEVTEEKRIIMQWKGNVIVNLSREFVDSAGAPKCSNIHVENKVDKKEPECNENFIDTLMLTAKDLNVCSKKGLVERFDTSIGAGSVLVPFGGATQKTPIQAMAAKIPVLEKETPTTSLFAYGFDPFYMESDPFMGAYDAVVESVLKLLTTGTNGRDVYLSLQEYFPSLRQDAIRWGQPFQAVLGALLAQIDLKMPAIGGKDSMSGSYEDLDVPPTLISFATTITKADYIISPEFKGYGNPVILLTFPRNSDGRLNVLEFDRLWNLVEENIKNGNIKAAWTISRGHLSEAIIKMSMGNRIGIEVEPTCWAENAKIGIGSIVLEVKNTFNEGIVLGYTTLEPIIKMGRESCSIDSIADIWESTLENVYPTKIKELHETHPSLALHGNKIIKGRYSMLKPKVIMPVFPGTNCEYDMKRSFESAGAEVELIVICNRTQKDLQGAIERMEKAIRSAQILAIPGGFSFGDEPDGSGKYIAAFFREQRLKDSIYQLLYKQDGLILGICNGFQALIKLGLLPYGKIINPVENDCTLTFNTIGRHQAKYIYTKTISVQSPWLQGMSVGDIHSIPISHGEGRFIASEETLKKLSAKGQIATQYVDVTGKSSISMDVNPNGSLWGIEGIISEDGRIFGKMGHSERIGKSIAKNIHGNKNQFIFESGVKYFK